MPTLNHRQPQRRRRLTTLVTTTLVAALFGLSASASSLRYYGNGSNDIDRVKIRIDNPADNNPGPPADVGNADFTLEFWVRTTTDNDAAAISCGNNNNWITGNIIIDRDRFAQDREWGISLGAGRLAFGVTNNSANFYTLCGSTDIRDDQWHHVALQRRRSDGRLWIWLDGSLEAEQTGPGGDVSYPDDGVPMDRLRAKPVGVLRLQRSVHCNWRGKARCRRAAQRLPAMLMSFVYPLRCVTRRRLRLLPRRSRQTTTRRPSTISMKAGGTFIGDSSFSGQSPGERRVGGSPQGPEWVSDTPFAGGGSAGSLQFSSSAYSGSEPGSTVTVNVTRSGGSSGPVSIDYATSDASANAGADYTAASGTLNWGERQRRNTIVYRDHS